MRRPRISIAALMVLIAVLAVVWFVMRAGLYANERAIRHNLSLCCSWTPDRRDLPKDEPVYPEYTSILDSDRLSTVLVLLALGMPPMVTLVAVGVVGLIRSLALRGRSAPFLLGFVVSGSAVLSCCVVCCLLATELVNYYAITYTDVLLYLPNRLIGGAIGDGMGFAIGCSAGTLVLGLPQLLLTLLGGRVNERKLRVSLIIAPRTESDPGPAPVVAVE